MAEYIHNANSSSHIDLNNMNKENSMIYRTADVVNSYPFKCFPDDSSSPIDTALSSSTTTTTESGGDDAADFFVAMMRGELARRLSLHKMPNIGDHKLYAPKTFENTWEVSGSPQSSLSGVGSWSGTSAMSVASKWMPKDHAQVGFPVKTQYYNEKECLEFLYAAAGQMERSRRYSDRQLLFGASRNSLQVAPDQPMQNLSPMRNPNKPLLTRNFVLRNQIQQQSLLMNQPPRGYSREELLSQQLRQIREQQQIQSRLMSSDGSPNPRCSVQPLIIPQSARLPLQLLSGSNVGMKKECPGTGVFLPRPYNNLVEHRNESGSTALQPSRAVPGLNLNANGMNSKSQLHFHGGFIPNQDVLMANKGNVISTQQNRSFNPSPVPLAQEISLPQEWTY